jgi:hypothetical protein
MAVIQEYYSSRFDPGAPALVTFLGGFMESRRELNQMAFKEQLAGIDPRAAALVEAAAIKRRTDLEKLAQDATLARDTLDAKKIKDSDDKMLKLFEITSERATALDVARQRELGEATSREQSRQYKIDAAVQDANARAETVGTAARTAVTAAGSSPAQIIQSIDKTVGDMLTGVGGQGGVYSNVRDPEAREAAKAKLYSEAYTQAKEAGAPAAVLENIRGKFGGKDPNAYLSEKFAARSTREISAGLPYAGSDLVDTMARSLNLSRADASSLLRSEVAPSSVGAPAPAPAAGATGPAVESMPSTGMVPAVPAPYGYETELAQAKALEENARAQRLDAAGGGGRFSQREVSRANLLYGMPYYRGNPQYDIENLTMGGGAGGAELTEEELAAAGVESMVEPTQIVQVAKKYKRESMPSGPAYMGGPALQPRGQVSAGEVLPEEREGALSVSALPRFVPVERAAPTEEDLLEAYIEDQRLQGRLRTADARAAIVESMPTGNK